MLRHQYAASNALSAAHSPVTSDTMGVDGRAKAKARERRQQVAPRSGPCGGCGTAPCTDMTRLNTPLALQPGADRLDRVLVAGERDRLRAVDRRHRDGPRTREQRDCGRVHPLTDREHASLAGGAVLQPARGRTRRAPRRRDRGAGRVHGRDLARAVADDRVRAARPSLPQCQQRRLEREVHRLREVGLGDPRRGARRASSSSTSDHSAWRRISRSQSSMTARNTGSAARSCRPMPHHCGPMPANTNATRGGVAVRRAPAHDDPRASRR